MAGAHAGDLPKAWVARPAFMTCANTQIGAFGAKPALGPLQVSLHGR